MPLLPLAFAAALTQPLNGALGFEFGAPLPESSIAAAIASPRPRVLPSNIEQKTLPEGINTTSGWFYLLPEQLPQTLARANPDVIGLLTADRTPARIIIEIPESGCSDLYAWLNESLIRKYRVEDDAVAVARAPYLRAARYTHEQRQIDVSCGPALRLQYTDTQAMDRWQVEQFDAHVARKQRYDNEQQAITLAAEFRARQYADSFTLGDSARLQGGLGVVFQQPLNQIAEFTADQPVEIVLDDLPAPFSSGTYQIELDPQQVPIELKGSIPDADGAHFDRVSRALRAKYGPPVKDSAQHKIFKVNGNFFVLRLLPRSAKTHVTLLDGSARREQRQRAKDQSAAEIAALEEQFRKETDGL